MIISMRDGKTPYIGSNGNWWIGNTDTGVKSQGEGGFGLGADTPVEVDHFDNITKTGWYKSKGGTPDGTYWYGMHIQYSEGFATQYICKYTGGSWARRCCVVGVWSQEWEWENPPMEPGVEYKLVEKGPFGSDVYTMCVLMDEINAGMFTTVPVNADMRAILSIEGYYGSDHFTGMNIIGDNKIRVIATPGTGRLAIDPDEDLSGYVATFILKYTK